MSTPPPDGLPFQTLGEYEVLGRISDGGMASIWLGRESAHPERFAALKVIRSEHGRNKDFVAMFVDEASIASRLAHPNIVSILGVGYDGKQHFLAMEVLRGHTLLAVMRAAHRKGKRLPNPVVAWVGARLADALHYAHELADDKGTPLHLVHRDVNPSNIFLTTEGAPKLIDFGLAKARDRIASTAIGVVKGKLAYLAPEQVQGKPVDRRSDVFALGVTLWEATLDRRLFFDGSDVATVRRVRDAEIPNPTALEKDYPEPLAQVLIRALARDPNERWQMAADFRDALDAYVAGSGRAVGGADVRAVLAEVFPSEAPKDWEHWIDEGAADREKTRVWEGSAAPAAPIAAPAPAASAPAPQAPVSDPRPDPPRDPPPEPEQVVQAPLWPTRRRGLLSEPMAARVVAVSVAGAGLGVLFVGLTVRGCRGAAHVAELERRVARIEEVLDMGEPGTAASAPGAPATASAAATGEPASADDRTAPCAVAKVAAYQAWQEAVTKAKANAKAAEGACASLWRESRRDACYYTATSSIRATQAARDTVIEGGNAAHEAARNVKDDPKNEAIARARTLSETAFAACEGDGGT